MKKITMWTSIFAVAAALTMAGGAFAGQCNGQGGGTGQGECLKDGSGQGKGQCGGQKKQCGKQAGSCAQSS